MSIPLKSFSLLNDTFYVPIDIKHLKHSNRFKSTVRFYMVYFFSKNWALHSDKLYYDYHNQVSIFFLSWHIIQPLFQVPLN